MKNNLQAIVKWPGGKISEAGVILPLLPRFPGRFIDPFVGGGAIFFAAGATQSCINDLSQELVSLYRFVQTQDEKFFFAIDNFNNNRNQLNSLIENDYKFFITLFNELSKEENDKSNLENKLLKWIDRKKNKIIDLTFKEMSSSVFVEELAKNLKRKILRTKKLSTENGGFSKEEVLANIETALHSAYYMYIRHLYNNAQKLLLNSSIVIATFYYMREFCYSSMFRYNQEGKFNVPYGGMAYNSKNFSEKINRLKSNSYQRYLRNTKIYNLDFEEFIKKISPTKEDFIFLDPPYDSDFSTYDGNSFTEKDHKRLANLMSETQSGFLMVIKKTDFVFDLYGSIPNVKVQSFEKKYMVSFQNRNDKNTKHLVITNYPLSVRKPELLRLSGIA